MHSPLHADPRIWLPPLLLLRRRRFILWCAISCYVMQRQIGYAIAIMCHVMLCRALLLFVLVLVMVLVLALVLVLVLDLVFVFALLVLVFLVFLPFLRIIGLLLLLLFLLLLQLYMVHTPTIKTTATVEYKTTTSGFFDQKLKIPHPKIKFSNQTQLIFLFLGSIRPVSCGWGSKNFRSPRQGMNSYRHVCRLSHGGLSYLRIFGGGAIRKNAILIIRRDRIFLVAS